MIGCVLLGGLAMLGVAAFARRRHRAWMRFHHGHRYGGDGCAMGSWDRCGPGCGYGCGCGSSRMFGGSSASRDGAGWVGGDDDDSRGPHLGFGGGRFGSRAGRNFFLRHLLRRVETTPTQGRAIDEALAEFGESTKVLRAEAKRSRADLATSLRRTSLDEVILGEMFARHDRIAEDLRKALVGLMSKVHDILDDIQRERLANLVEKGGLRGGFAGTGPSGGFPEDSSRPTGL